MNEVDAKFDFAAEMRRARASGDPQARQRVLDKARAHLRRQQEERRLKKVLWTEIEDADGRERWHRAARNLVESAPLLRWGSVLDLMTLLDMKKPRNPSRPVWRQLQAVTYQALERCIAGFVEKVGRSLPALESARAFHWTCAEIVDAA